MSAAAAQSALEQRRVAGIKAIHAARRQLGLDDGAYRSMLQAQTGKASATQLTVAEQSKVLDYLRAQGAVNPRKRHQAPGSEHRAKPGADRAKLVQQVHDLLGAISTVMGEPHGIAYADAICRRNGWADTVTFCSPQALHKLVGALSRTLRARQQSQGFTVNTGVPKVQGHGTK